ncbi:uncharacterized protein LOC102803378, partial [Saccoglossus kowalevskii]|uniref:Uncharacterized protein LOC102803378 n=1 Tax=Saccoglossus kowalevskii TaxID=10224 RepID=A0ABM0MBG7_SACKO
SGLETWEQTEELLCGFITDKMDIDGSQIEFQIVHRLTYARSRPQPIIGKFLRYKQRDEVLRAAEKLKGTEFRIREDFTPKIRDLRRKLGKFVVDARAEGKTVKVLYDKIKIDDTVYIYDEVMKNIKPLRSLNYSSPLLP